MKINRYLNPDMTPEQKTWAATLDIGHPNQCLYVPIEVALSVVRPSVNDYFFDAIKELLSEGYLPYIYLEKKGIRTKTFLDAKKIKFYHSNGDWHSRSISMQEYLVMQEGLDALKIFLDKVELTNALNNTSKVAQISLKTKNKKSDKPILSIKSSRKNKI